MVLSDLILGWSQLVTGHADSLIISYLKDATCKICSVVYCCEVSHDGTFLKNIPKDATVTDYKQ